MYVYVVHVSEDEYRKRSLPDVPPATAFEDRYKALEYAEHVAAEHAGLEGAYVMIQVEFRDRGAGSQH